MLEKAIRKAVLSILLASLMVGAGCRITYAEEQQQTTESKVATDDTFVQAPSALLMEAGTGTVIYEKDPDTRRSPASITKIMTLILIFDALENGTLKMDDLVTTSAYAKSMGGSQVFLEEGETQDVETMIKCIVIASGNDASVAMAEHIAGTESEFVSRMNQKAKELGMNDTKFEDCCGLTDSDGHYTTAADVAKMSRELIERFPQILNYSSIWMENIIHRTAQGEKEFCLTNTNKLIRSYEGCVGLKTGSTSVAKYCVSAVAQRGEMTLLAVVMGAPDAKVRFKDAAALLDYGFGKCNLYLDENRKNPDPVPIKGGVKAEVSCRYTGEFRYLDTEGKNLSQIEKKIVYMKNLQAPVKKGDIVGEAQYLLDGKVIGKTDIVAAKSVKKAGLWDYIKHIRKRMIKGDDYLADR